MSIQQGRIKSILILESEMDDTFSEFCKLVRSITKDVECLYNVNKESLIIRSNINIKIYRSTAYFKIKKFKTLILIWKILNCWGNISGTKMSFHILAIRKGVSYLEFDNDNFERYPYNKKPSHFDFHFRRFPKNLKNLKQK